MIIPTKPTILLIPGAWHLPSSFAPTTKLLLAQNYKIHPISLPSVGPPPHIQSFTPDVDLIRSTLHSILALGEDVVMLFHSYGGVPGCEALGEYLKMKVDGGKEGWGRVRRLVFCAAFVLPEGGSLMEALGGKDLPWFEVDGDTVLPSNPQTIFYNDIPPSLSSPYISALLPHAYPTFSSKLTVATWKSIPSTYILCENDNAIPIQAQEGMIEIARGMAEGSFDTVERCEAGHSPFISMPEWLAGRIVKAAGGSGEV